MSDAHVDVTRLHDKLHALETVRAKEMQSHGQHVQQLQLQLTSCRVSEKELQLTVAKLRAEKCRMEAEMTANGAKLRGLEVNTETLERQRERWTEDFRHRLLSKEDEITKLHRIIDGLKQSQADKAVVDAERKTTMATLQREIDRLTTERDDARLVVAANAQEISQLATRLAVQHTEVETERSKVEHMRQELDSSNQEQLDQTKQIQILTRKCEKLESTRLRLATFNHARITVMEHDVRFRDVFLEWKAQTLAAKVKRSRELQLEAQQRLERMKLMQKKLRTEFETARVALEIMKTWLQTQQQDFRSWHEICTAQLSSQILPRFQEVLANTVRVADAKITTMNVQLQLEQARHETELEQAHQMMKTSKLTYKNQVKALLGRLELVQRHHLRAQAFHGWKDVYLRNIVAETTHAVMVARTARSMTASMLHHDALGQVKTEDKAIPVVPKPRSPMRTKHESLLSLRQPQLTIDPTLHINEDEQWKRWRRRVAPTDPKIVASSSRRSSVTSATSTTPSIPQDTTRCKAKTSINSQRRASII